MPRYFALAFGSIFLVTIGHAANPPQPLVPVTVTAGFHHRGPKHPSGGAQATCIGVENQHNPFKDATELAVNPPKTLGHKGNLTSDVWTIGGEGASTVKIAEYYSARGPITVRLLDTTGNLLKEHVIPRDPPAGGGPADKRVGLNTVLWDIGDPQQVSKTKVAKIVANAGIPEPPNAGNAGAYVILKLEYTCCNCQEWSVSQQQCVTRAEWLNGIDISELPQAGTDQIVPPLVSDLVQVIGQMFNVPQITPVQDAWLRLESKWCCPDVSPSGCDALRRYRTDWWLGGGSYSAKFLDYDFGGMIGDVGDSIIENFGDNALRDQCTQWLAQLLPTATGVNLSGLVSANLHKESYKNECSPTVVCRADSTRLYGAIHAISDSRFGQAQWAPLGQPLLNITCVHVVVSFSFTGNVVGSINNRNVTMSATGSTEWQIGEDFKKSHVLFTVQKPLVSTPITVCPSVGLEGGGQ
jgi:hypothetical protein